MIRFLSIFVLTLLASFAGMAQSNQQLFTAETFRSPANHYYWKNRAPDLAYWQQDVYYTIKAELDDVEDVIDGNEQLTYYNNSPDTLNFVYFHLYQKRLSAGFLSR
jgi:hypothetical protein